ncbi:ALQxL family class IV lanthipeptide [Micromonospora echinofusca]|uniref:Uncharacterized protein n=1 Tax=Micromonospora echinofusca TaxID=47858 RepID=A0A1C5G7V7_MICEH|nr:ALQxL family class IV lanthipeptide [Micromonospora echinofusca]SCG15652.1 hypothetical protein GA0070610_1893 [Micromonospora echinofusca]
MELDLDALQLLPEQRAESLGVCTETCWWTCTWTSPN